MKKISLKNVRNSLNRDEMRAISGGCGCAATSDDNFKSCSVSCISGSNICKGSCPCVNSFCTPQYIC